MQRKSSSTKVASPTFANPPFSTASIAASSQQHPIPSLHCAQEPSSSHLIDPFGSNSYPIGVRKGQENGNLRDLPPLVRMVRLQPQLPQHPQELWRRGWGLLLRPVDRRWKDRRHDDAGRLHGRPHHVVWEAPHTLRNLKDLATIRSNFVSLKSSLLDEAHHTPDAVSQEASDLLIKLDSIQSRDSLINEGKRAIRAELSQFLESVEGLSAKCHSNLPPKLKKRVTFAENAIPPGADSARNIKSEEVREFLSVGENEEDGCHPEMEGFHNQMSDGIFKNGLKGNFHGQIGGAMRHGL
ncbi:hypothetical protein MRB53_005690 [Persea americana]|uniref:Uncharacterized protein n=1 Tax=Persea americana TaxID=3435 RepID=A0ACC2ME39_PERAE|nr:hypothetical protein MRB53_005690 [Persea americana]